MLKMRRSFLSVPHFLAVTACFFFASCGNPFGGLSKTSDKYHPGVKKNVEELRDPAAPTLEAFEFTSVDGVSAVQDVSVDPAAPTLEAAASFGVAVNEQGEAGVPAGSIVPTQSLLPDATESACGGLCEMNKIFLGFLSVLTD